ncbi:tat pathway signal sequence [Amycolatopsis albispora]|uniref:Tat pathway signal sequence n=1 Tax=Amycolatopsis albispora TaxID=1804986 RepID=A0A344LKE8_9PSEU|nr:tat pathway signal sequence [Amycolatopsis albispora]
MLLAALVTSPVAQARPVPAAGDDPAAAAPGFEPELGRRILRAESYARSRPGFAGIVVHDRQTGATWRNANSDTLIWACSTPKLAMVVDLLLRDDAGAVDLTDEDRALMHAMLNTSDNDAAHTLWNRYGGEDFATRFPSYGMTDMRFTDEHPHHWGWILTTADDLGRLMDFVLERMPVEHRDYIVGELRAVDANQQWGVWGAGPAAKPGNKNGWSDDNNDGSWLVNTVGFVGPDERYTVAVMNNTQVVEGGFETGVETTTRVNEILFRGYFG